VAIEVVREDPFGTLHPTSYARITQVAIQNGAAASVVVVWFIHEGARRAGKPPFHASSFELPIAALTSIDGPIAAAYVWLRKSVAEFKAGRDV